MVEVASIQQLFRRSVRCYGDKVFCAYTDPANNYRQLTYRQYATDVTALSAVLLKNRASLTGWRIGIIGPNSYEWVVVFMAVMNSGGIVVPLDKEFTAQELSHCLQRVELDMVFYAQSVASVVESVSKQYKRTQFMPMWSTGQDSLITLLAVGKKINNRQQDGLVGASTIKPDDCALLLFTSGTTTQSKIVMLSQRNVALSVQRGGSCYAVRPQDRLLSILPLHHMFECNIGFLIPFCWGASIYFSRGVRYMRTEIRTWQPTILICVPRVVDVLLANIWKGIRVVGKERMVCVLINFFERMNLNISLRRWIFWEIHKQLGGKIRFFLVGAAPLGSQTLREMTALGFTVYHGYGLTECSPAVASTMPAHNKDNDSVGVPIPGVDVKIIDPDDNGVGEIIIKSSHIMLGYYKNPALTKQAIRQGYLYTGDLGLLKSNGYLKIIGRKKNIIVTSNGKKIYPEEIESLLMVSPAIKDVVVYGQNMRHGQRVCASIVVPDASSPVERRRFEQQARQYVDHVNNSLARFERIQQVEIRSDDFARTSTLKIKRHLIHKTTTD